MSGTSFPRDLIDDARALFPECMVTLKLTPRGQHLDFEIGHLTRDEDRAVLLDFIGGSLEHRLRAAGDRRTVAPVYMTGTRHLFITLREPQPRLELVKFVAPQDDQEDGA